MQTLWRKAKDVLLDREYYEIEYNPVNDLVYECDDCGYIYRLDDLADGIPSDCPSCLGYTDELGSTEEDDCIWLLLNEFQSPAVELANQEEIELDILHQTCDCKNPPSLFSPQLFKYTSCEYTILLDDLVPICHVCDGCLFCRYNDDIKYDYDDI